MVVILKPKHDYQIFSRSYLSVLVDYLGEEVSTLNIVKHKEDTESRTGTKDRQKEKLTYRLKEKKGKATEPKKERLPREARKMFTSAHPCKAHMTLFPSPR